MPTAQECATGDFNGVWLGPTPTTLATCRAAGGRIAVYAAGNPTALCGTVIVNDTVLTGDPASDPNECAGTLPVPGNANWTEAYFPSGDGTILHADIFRPNHLAPNVTTPVLLFIGPYFNSGGSLLGPQTPTNMGPTILPYYSSIITAALAENYTVVDVSLRGFGASGGCGDLGGPGEQADAKAAVEWAASRPWSTGRVGTYGISYDGWSQIMGLAGRPAGLAASVIESPLIDYYRAIFMNRNRRTGLGYYSDLDYSVGDLTPPSIFSDPRQFTNALSGTATSPGCYASKPIALSNSNPRAQFWRERNLIPAASGSTVPILWSHGFLDHSDEPDQFLDVWSTLGGPKRAWFGQYDHVGPEAQDIVGRAGFLAEAMRWLDCYVKQDAAQCAVVGQDPAVVIQQDDGRWRAESSWPPSDATRLSLPIRPGSYLDLPGNDAQSGSADLPRKLLSRPSLRQGVGSWTFTQQLPYDVHFAGVPRVTARIDSAVPNVNLVALLYDLDAGRQATLISRGAYVIPKDGTITFDLFPEDWRIEKGHRIGLLLSGADDSWFTPGTSGTSVRVIGGSVSLPFLAIDRNVFLDGGHGVGILTRGPFAVAPKTVAARTVTAPLPPPLS